MTQQEKSITEKTIAELSAEEKLSLTKPIGLPGLPYPMTFVTQDDKKNLTMDVGHSDPMFILSTLSAEKINGELFRNMPIPSMMPVMKKIIMKLQPQSKNRVLTVFGDPAFGKSFLFKMIAGMAHPKGAISVDCGGMNMREIFFRTVIDYGNGVKEQLDKKASAGKIKAETVEFINAVYPGSIVEKDGKQTINWSVIGRRKTEMKDDGKKEVSAEGYEEAAKREIEVMKVVYAKEDISLQSNAFGIKTVPGEFFEALNSGRPLFLDEFNKSKAGTLDTWQTALQFLNGEKGFEKITIYNPMAQAGDGDSPKSITIDRSQIAPGFFVCAAGNDITDGDTTHELSESMKTRLDVTYVGEPTLDDFKHRTSQIWTGLPLSTLYNVFGDAARSNPVAFGNFLRELRQIGLTQDEIKMIPVHQMKMLDDWQSTLQGVNQYAAVLREAHELGNPESPLFEKKAYKDLADELQGQGSKAKRLSFSFRDIIRHTDFALETRPAVTPKKDGHLDMDLTKLFREADVSSLMGAQQPGWLNFGTGVAEALFENIINVTIGMPQTRAALQRLCETNGVADFLTEEAKKSQIKKTLPELMKYDPSVNHGNLEDLRRQRSVLISFLKSMYPDIKGADDKLIPLPKLGEVLAQVNDKVKKDPGVFVVPNMNLNGVDSNPVLAAEVVPSAEPDSDSVVHFSYKTGKVLPFGDPNSRRSVDGYDMVDFRAILAGMAMPDYKDSNRQKMWPKDFSQHIDFECDDSSPKGKKSPSAGDEDEAETEIVRAEVAKQVPLSIKGESAACDFSVFAGADGAGKKAYLYCCRDKERDVILVVGPEEISPQLLSSLKKSGIIYTTLSNSGAVGTIDSFVADSVNHRLTNGSEIDKKGLPKIVVNALIQSFSAVCGHSASSDGSKVTVGTFFDKNPNATPVIYTAVMQKKLR